MSSTEPKQNLVVVWTSGDQEVARTVVFPYVLNARTQGWFDSVTFVVWGPSARLLAATDELQSLIAEMLANGVEIEACRKCASDYGVAEQLESLHIDVRYMGEPLSSYIKEGRHVLTF